MSSTNSHSSSTGSELTPLVGAPVGSATDNNPNGNFYFLTRKESIKSVASKANNPADAGEVVEILPYGATEGEFASRPVIVSFLFFLIV